LKSELDWTIPGNLPRFDVNPNRGGNLKVKKRLSQQGRKERIARQEGPEGARRQEIGQGMGHYSIPLEKTDEGGSAQGESRYWKKGKLFRKGRSGARMRHDTDLEETGVESGNGKVRSGAF